MRNNTRRNNSARSSQRGIRCGPGVAARLASSAPGPPAEAEASSGPGRSAGLAGNGGDVNSGCGCILSFSFGKPRSSALPDMQRGKNVARPPQGLHSATVSQRRTRFTGSPAGRSPPGWTGKNNLVAKAQSGVACYRARARSSKVGELAEMTCQPGLTWGTCL